MQTNRVEAPVGQAAPVPRHSLVERDLMASVRSSAVAPAEDERLVADVGSWLPATQLQELPAAQLLELDTVSTRGATDRRTVTTVHLPSQSSALTLLRLPLLSLLRSLLLNVNIGGVTFICTITEDILITFASAMCVRLSRYIQVKKEITASNPWICGALERRTDSDGSVVAVPVIVLDSHVRGATGGSTRRTAKTTS
jgi:hypothetical protein